MGFRFRKSVKIAPGVKVNFNKKSTSVSFGGKGASFTQKLSKSGKETWSEKIATILIVLGIICLFSNIALGIGLLITGAAILIIRFILVPKLAAAAQKTTGNIIGAMQGKTDDDNEVCEQEE